MSKSTKVFFRVSDVNESGKVNSFHNILVIYISYLDKIRDIATIVNYI